MSEELKTWEASEASRLDAFLAERLGEGSSRVQAQAWIKEGRCRIGGRAVRKPSHKLKPGDAVQLALPPPPPPLGPLQAEDLPLPLLYQDEHLLVVDKPAGMTVHPGAGQREGTLVNALLHHSPEALSRVGGEERPGIVHRLDKDTSGVIVVARSDRAHRELARQFHDREVRKRYLALTEGVPREREGEVDLPLGRHPKDRKRQAVVEDGRPALTRYRVLEDFGGHAYVECRPQSGRTHQIRVHMLALGAPLLADATYGRGRPERFTRRDAGLLAGPDEVLLARHALHASRLELTHPQSGRMVTFEAPLPADFVAALTALREAAKPV